MSKELVKMLIEFQNQNPNHSAYSTETYIAALIATANYLSKELQP